MISVDDFDYFLSPSSIASYPAKDRANSRLLYVGKDKDTFVDLRFQQILRLAAPGDLLVFNDSKVIPARLRGRRSSGGKMEILIERVVNERQATCSLFPRRRARENTEIFLDGGISLRVLTLLENKFYLLAAPAGETIKSILRRYGETPLPPYIKRPAVAMDRERYQTVYARNPGSVAAPTAGLHFSEELLAELGDCDVSASHITLHIGAGTFSPLRACDIRNNRLHSERFAISLETCSEVAACRKRGGRVIAVGTTVLRALEAAAGGDGELTPQQGETDLFISVGYDFKVVDALITNFHLPRSSLFVLVCAFAGLRRMHAVYETAKERGYRFYSYGDAMFVDRDSSL